MDELLVMARCDHPYIVRLHGACLTPPRMCYVMELCRESLYASLHERQHEPPPPQLDLVRYAMETAEALSYLHNILSPSVIHRDLKSLNLLIAHDGHIRVCDFGLVRAKKSKAGTPAYMAPELLRERPFNKKVDVWAFGMVLWEFFAREIPFFGMPPGQISDDIARGVRPELPIPGCPEVLQSQMKRCWEEDAYKRPDFDILSKELFELLQQLQDQSTDDGTAGSNAFIRHEHSPTGELSVGAMSACDELDALMMG